METSWAQSVSQSTSSLLESWSHLSWGIPLVNTFLPNSCVSKGERKKGLIGWSQMDWELCFPFLPTSYFVPERAVTLRLLTFDWWVTVWDTPFSLVFALYPKSKFNRWYRWLWDTPFHWCLLCIQNLNSTGGIHLFTGVYFSLYPKSEFSCWSYMLQKQT